MINQTILIGRLVSEPVINETENEKKVCTVTLAVKKSFKNVDGEYDIDFIPVVLWNSIATNVGEYCHKGDMVGVKGHLQSRDNKIEVVAEKITFLSSSTKDDNEG